MSKFIEILTKKLAVVALIKSILFWVTAGTGSLILLYAMFSPSLNTDFGDAALGVETQTVVGYLDGDRVHCFELSDAEQCISPANNRALESRVLWFGNSQLHAINQPRSEDEPASVLAARKLRPHGIELLTFSQPNANLAEHLILFEALSQVYRFDMLVLPIVFDDMREQSLRPSIKEALADPTLAALLEITEVGLELSQLAQRAKESSSDSLQIRSEKMITTALDACCGWESLRKQARGGISLFVYQLRNYVFGINPSSIRRMIPSAYTLNMAAYETILTLAQARGIQILVYVPPLRSDVKTPYEPSEYAGFLEAIETLAGEYGADFVNLENIVPGPLWGMKDATSIGGKPEFDFMHFQAAGHALLSESIVDEVLRVSGR